MSPSRRPFSPIVLFAAQPASSLHDHYRCPGSVMGAQFGVTSTPEAGRLFRAGTLHSSPLPPTQPATKPSTSHTTRRSSELTSTFLTSTFPLRGSNTCGVPCTLAPPSSSSSSLPLLTIFTVGPVWLPMTSLGYAHGLLRVTNFPKKRPSNISSRSSRAKRATNGTTPLNALHIVPGGIVRSSTQPSTFARSSPISCWKPASSTTCTRSL